MTKEQLIDLCIRSVKQGTITSESKDEYHPKVFELFIDTVYSTIVRDVDKTGDQFALDSYIKSPPDELTVQKDTVKNAYYVTLDTPCMQLTKNRGLREIHPIKDPTSSFAIMANIGHATFHHTEVFDIDNTGQAKVEGKKIWLYHPNMADYTTMLVKQLIPFSSMDDDLDIPMPVGTEELIIERVKKLVERYPQSLEDTINDNNG